MDISSFDSFPLGKQVGPTARDKHLLQRGEIQIGQVKAGQKARGEEMGFSCQDALQPSHTACYDVSLMAARSWEGHNRTGVL